jgi:hypothetical protein
LAKKNINDFEKDSDLVALRKSLLSIYDLKISSQEHSIIDTGMLAEVYCKKLFSLRSHQVWNGSFDAETMDGKEKIEIKTRRTRFKNKEIACPLGMKVKEKIDWLFYVFFNEDFTLKSIWAFHKSGFTRQKNGRVSFKEAFHKDNYERIYDDAPGMKNG